MRRTLEIALAALLVAVGVVFSGAWFYVLTSKAYPVQHLINTIAGVMLGPVWAAVIAIIVGILRNMFGLGTVYAFPGGIPGGIVVWAFYRLFRRLGSRRTALIAAFTEPIGTVLIGGTLSLLVVAPWIGDVRMLERLNAGLIPALLALWAGWLASSLTGAVIGFLVLLGLERAGILGEWEALKGERR